MFLGFNLWSQHNKFDREKITIICRLFERNDMLTSFMKLFRSKFIKNWTLLFGSNMLGQALGLLATIRIARALNPTGFGQYNLLQTIAV